MTRLFSLLFILSCGFANAQSKLLVKPVSNKKTYDRAIIDSTYGITMYDKLVAPLGGDSIRNCNGYACNGWVEDHYTSGQLLHKGFYQNGQLRTFRNYYPNGQLEKQFKAIDDYKSSLKSYYENGNPKSDVLYDEGTPIQWTDYYSNGQVEFVEIYNKGGDYYLSKKSFFEDGKPETIMELTNQKKKIYISKEFHSNGSLKEEGTVVFNPDLLDYQKIGTWKVFKADGKPRGEQVYVNGKLDTEVTY